MRKHTKYYNTKNSCIKAEYLQTISVFCESKPFWLLGVIRKGIRSRCCTIKCIFWHSTKTNGSKKEKWASDSRQSGSDKKAAQLFYSNGYILREKYMHSFSLYLVFWRNGPFIWKVNWYYHPFWYRLVIRSLNASMYIYQLVWNATLTQYDYHSIGYSQ